MNLVLSQRLLLISLVVVAHLLLFIQWEGIPAPVETSVSVSLISVNTPSLPTMPPPKPSARPLATPKLASSPATPELASTPETQAAPSPSPPSITPPATPQAAPQIAVAAPQIAAPQIAAHNITPAPLPPDREPDYQAAYLNNPTPTYPKMATKMGWQGKVMVNVEVLTTGRAGQVSLQRSSGHEALDDAALQAVRTWRFLPARQNGQLVSKYFLIPIPFILKDHDE